VDTHASLAQVTAPIGILSLSTALSLALHANPTLAASGWEVHASAAHTLQAGLLPNPAVGLDIEDVAGSGSLQGVAAAEITLSISQALRLAGKRQKQARVAALERDLAAWAYEATRLDVITQVRQAFIDVLQAQERSELHADLVRLAEQVVAIAEARVRAGKVSPIEATRARVALAQARIAQSRTQQLLTSARTRLAITWGSPRATFEGVDGQLDNLTPPPTAEHVMPHVTENPDVARWATNMAQRQAVVDLEAARRVPDPTLAGGVRYANASGDAALVFGLSVPWPIFDRNQGNLQEAQARLAKTAAERQVATSTVTAALGDAYATLATAFTESLHLRDTVLPGAQQAFAATQTGYRQGKFSFLEVLDAQRTLFDVRSQYLDALAAYHQAVAMVERLIGAPLSTLAPAIHEGSR
jgi:cobalt-zinc-cadmium efflux system outer membrane protein